MIIRPRPGVLKLFFVMRGSIVPRIAPQIVGFGFYFALIVAPVKRGGVELGNYDQADCAIGPGAHHAGEGYE